MIKGTHTPKSWNQEYFWKLPNKLIPWQCIIRGFGSIQYLMIELKFNNGVLQQLRIVLVKLVLRITAIVSAENNSQSGYLLHVLFLLQDEARGGCSMRRPAESKSVFVETNVTYVQEISLAVSCFYARVTYFYKFLKDLQDKVWFILNF